MANVERGGVASVYHNGSYIEVGASIEIKPGGIINTPVVSSDGVAGYTTKFVQPELTLEAIDGGSVSVLALKAIKNETIQVRLNNGKTYQLFGAITIDDPSIAIHDGKISSLKFFGTRLQEIGA